jgi:hypothetical protein
MTTVKTIVAASPLRHGKGGDEVVNDPSIVHPKTAPPPSPPPPHACATRAGKVGPSESAYVVCH